MINILKEMYYILTKKQLRKGVLVVFVSLIGAGFELLGVSAILPFIQVLLETEEVMQNGYIVRICEILHITSVNGIITLYGLLLIGVYIFKNLYLIFMGYIELEFATKFRCDLSEKIMKSYLHREYAFHLNNNSSILMRGVISDVNGVYLILNELFHMVAEVLTIAAIGVFLFVSDPIMAMTVIGLIGICILWFLFSFRKKVKEAGLRNNVAQAEVSKYSLQAFGGIKDILVLQRKEFFVNSFNHALQENANTAKKQNMIDRLPARIFETVCVGGIIGIVCILNAIGEDTSAMVAKLAVFAVAAFRAIPAAGRLSNSMNTIMFQRPTLDNTHRVLKEIEQIKQDKEDFIDETQAEKKEFLNAITVNHISWCYDGKKEKVLDKLSITIPKGKSIAFIGSSGAGKTTLADVILGLLQPQEGSVLVDGMDIFAHKKEWSRMVGYVPQVVFLTDDTIRNNIAFGIPYDEIDDDKIWQSLEQAQLAQFVRSLEGGLDTMVGERGVRFSGGQRQRIAIARALYHNPDILVLDEATSALDNETELAVMDAIDALHGLKTLIIVAHRLSTIENCDEIYEIGNGVAIKKEKADVLGK